MKTLACLALLLTLAACDFTKDIDPWGTWGKANCDRYGNNCQPLCTQYGNCTSGVHGNTEQ